MADMTDKAINWIGQQKALIPDKPSSCILRLARHMLLITFQGMGGQIQRQIRSGLGQAARGNVCPSEEARRYSERLPIDGAAQGDSIVG